MKKHLSLLSLVFAFLTVLPQAAEAQVNEYLKVVKNATIVVKKTGTPEMPDLQYQIDNGSWTQISIEQLPCTLTVPGLGVGETVQHEIHFKGNNPGGFNKSATDFISFAITGGNPAVAGNVMSLIGGDNFSSLTAIPCDYCFYALFSPYPPTSFATSFSSSSTSASTSLAHAHELVLPATELKPYCYAYMFAQNSGLYSAPELPATVMQPWCYAHMFEYCINDLGSQTAANSGHYLPNLPAQQLAEGCYAYMFNRCSSLYNDNENYYILPAEELAPKCYMGMFGLYNAKGTTLRYVEIMATSLQDRCGNDLTNCCAYIFNNAIAAGTYLGRGGLTVRFYWLDWGAFNGTAQTGDGPAQSWFLGYSQSYNKFIYQKGLTPVTKAKYEKDYPTKMYSAPFPYSSTLTEQDFTYLTFDCKTNGGTWEEGCTYDADLRRVVRSDYKAKTVPAAPVKAGDKFKGWYTAPTGGTKVDEATILNQTTPQTYYAQFGEGGDDGGEGGGDNPEDETDLSNIKMSRGVLDMPTYYSFAILGENEQVTVRLHFSTMLKINTTNYLNNLTYDIANTYIQPAGGEKRQIASASLAKVEYLGDAYRAAHLTAKVTDTDGNDYNIDIFTNEELNAATYEDVYGTNYNFQVETSWRTCNPFHIYGTENNEMERLIYRNYQGRHLLYTFHGDYGVNLYYEVLHVQIELFPDASKPGNIPTGIYPINATQEVGTAFIGRCPDDILVYEQNQRQPYCGTFVQYELQAKESDYYPNRDVWTLRDGYVEVVNVDEKYWVHVHAYADAHRTTNKECAVIDYTACLDEDENGNSYTITTADVTLAAQTEGGAQLSDAATMRLKDASTMTSSFPQGEYKFFTGNTLTLNAAKTGYEFSHWLINGSRVDGNNIEYTVTNQAATIVAVFTGDGNGGEGGGEGGDDPETPIVSQDESVNVYQNVSKTTTKILYNLDERKGKDGLRYKPVDLGTGIAWADRNMGATQAGEVGAYFRWGGIIPGGDNRNNTFRTNYCYDVYGTGIIDGEDLPASADAATQIMGDWRIPTADEWIAMKDNTDYSSGYYTNQSDIDQFISLPAAGEYTVDYYSNICSLYAPEDRWYWSSTLSGLGVRENEWYEQTPENAASTAFYYYDNGSTTHNVYSDGYIIFGMPVRAVYTPPFTTYTLTIRVGKYEYRYICQTGQKVTVTAIATEEGAEFVKWEEDGLTDAVRTFTMTGDMVYTAIFTDNSEPETPEMSPDANVTVYQSVTKSTMKILYDLSAKKGKDGLWYTPVDLGYGVAWADRNVGANSEYAIGDYFRWGDPVAGTSFGNEHPNNLDVTYYQTYDRLTPAQDAATVNIGSAWRMPDEEDFYQLKTNSVITDNNTFTNKDDNSVYIILPAGGYMGSKQYDGSNQYYWSRQFGQHGANSCSASAGYGKEEYNAFALVRTGYNEYYVQTMDMNDCYGNETYLGMPVRAIYVPQFNVCTLTVNVKGYQYVYLCQEGQNVTVTAVANEGYEFDRWTQDGNTEAVRTFTVNGNMTYTATFKQAKQEYNIIYKDKDDQAFSGVHAAGYPTVHTYGTATVLKTATKEGYNFLGWYLTKDCTGSEVTRLGATAYNGDITLYALWKEVQTEEPEDPQGDELHIILYEDRDAAWYNSFSDKYNGKKATTVTYNRQFTQSKWATLCLPFDVSTSLLNTMKMTGRVYEFKYTKGDQESGLTLYFGQAKSLVAGKGYIVNANAALAKKNQFIFPGVVINTEADINSGFNIENLEGHNTQGDVYLVGTLRTGLLIGSATGNRYMGLKDNKIYYPNSSEGTRLLAYRGIFRSSVDINAPRVRIVVEDAEGGQVSELEVVSGEPEEMQGVRKFIRDGVLYIDRDGKCYTAQGARAY